MRFLIALVAMFMSLQGSMARANSLENFVNAPGLGVKFEDFASVLEGICNSGNAEYCQKLAFIIERRKNPKLDKDRIVTLHQRALNQFEKQCDLNDLISCQNASIIYQVGYGLEIDSAKAQILGARFNALAAKLCDAGKPLGCFYTSNRHNGTGSSDYDIMKARQYSELSVKYFTQECTNKNAQSCELLAHRYKNGQIYGGFIAYDIQRAIMLFDTSCQYGNATACIELSHIYLFRVHIKRDKLKSVLYKQKGCDLDNSIACWNLLKSNILPSGVKRGKIQTAKIQERMVYLAKKNCSEGKLPECSLLVPELW